MSADNYIAIWKCKDGFYRGYDLSASCEQPKRRPKFNPTFVAKTVEGAIQAAQEEYTEYGYYFVNLEKEKICP